MRLLISDANILIDMEAGALMGTLFQLPIEVWQATAALAGSRKSAERAALIRSCHRQANTAGQWLQANARCNTLHAVAQSIRSCSKRTFCPQRCCLRPR